MNAQDEDWLEARSFLAALDFERAVKEFRSAATRDPSDRFAERTANEIERFRWAQQRPDIEGIFVETASLCEEADLVFEMRLKDRCVIGRKLLSPPFVQDKIDELFCGRISQEQILGERAGVRLSERNVRLHIDPFTRRQREQFFEDFRQSPEAEIVFPYARLVGSARREPRAQDEGWHYDSTLEARLAAGESAQRDWVVSDIARHLKKGATVFDPACGTGEVLAAVKSKRPDILTLGQDLSQTMVKRAQLRADRVVHQDARIPIAEVGSADALIIRFLNADVVTTRDAQNLFKNLAKTLHKKGRLYAYGHTPLRVDSLDFAMAGLRVLSSLASDDEGQIFQAYIAQHED